MGRLVFATSTEVLRVPADAVVFVSADGYDLNTPRVPDGEDFVLTMQLGQIEKRLAEMLDGNDNRFIRIGKSLIVNREYITFINPSRQKLLLSDCRTFRREVSASKDALKALKDYVEKEVQK